MQFAILAQSLREMSQTDRIHPRYFLLRVLVSIRPRIFCISLRQKTPNQSPAHRRARSHASAPPTVRTAQFERQVTQVYRHARWRLTTSAGAMDDFVGTQNHPSLRNSYPRCNDPAKRGSVCEAFEKKPLPLALTLLLRYRYRPVLLGNICER